MATIIIGTITPVARRTTPTTQQTAFMARMPITMRTITWRTIATQRNTDHEPGLGGRRHNVPPAV